jgi:hypothetical protein
LKRKGDGVQITETQRFEKEVADTTFKMDILVERSTQHFKNAMDRFTELDMKLKQDPRLHKLYGKNND